MFFYAGYSKLINNAWSSESYLINAKTFTSFYSWLASPSMLEITNLLNEWGLTLLGISLVIGLGVRISAPLGAILMLLYYFPALDFPYPNAHAFIVDEHLIYASTLLFLSSVNAGQAFGLDAILKKRIRQKEVAKEIKHSPK